MVEVKENTDEEIKRLTKFCKEVKAKPIQTYTQTSVKLTKTKQDWGCHSSELSYYVKSEGIAESPLYVCIMLR